jgi:hypothetical protein
METPEANTEGKKIIRPIQPNLDKAPKSMATPTLPKNPAEREPKMTIEKK